MPLHKGFTARLLLVLAVFAVARCAFTHSARQAEGKNLAQRKMAASLRRGSIVATRHSQEPLVLARTSAPIAVAQAAWVQANVRPAAGLGR
jgi:hypothetical protein